MYNFVYRDEFQLLELELDFPEVVSGIIIRLVVISVLWKYSSFIQYINTAISY